MVSGFEPMCHVKCRLNVGARVSVGSSQIGKVVRENDLRRRHLQKVTLEST